jgi:hydroxymethylpyrimidine/phosphomethylpyrimidine kinase
MIVPMAAPPVALTIAGSDCSGGAGLQADLKTFSALGVHGLTAVTAVVAETPHTVHGVYPVDPTMLQEQLRILLDTYPIAAIKTGMLGTAPHVVAVAELLAGREIPLVIDPVMVASSGDLLVPPDAVGAYRERLLPLATLVTPNLPEAHEFSDGTAEPTAQSLAQQLGCAVLLTGGHNVHAESAIDVLCDVETIREYRSPWVTISSSHGSGCTLSAAITANLAHGMDLPSAVECAKEFITRALRESYAWTTREGEGEIRALNQLPVAFFGDRDSK